VILLQTPAVLWLSQVSDVKQKEINTPEPLVPEPNVIEDELAIEI
jgi:hypothetical protein